MKTKEFFLQRILSYKDADDTAEANKFYSEYWSDLCNNDKINLRGDTINSFNTALNCIVRCLDGHNRLNAYLSKEKQDTKIEYIAKNCNQLIEDDKFVSELLKKISYFKDIYHSRANFIPLHKNSRNNINTKRNFWFNDFADKFLMSIRWYYTDKNKLKRIYSDSTYNCLIENKMYFDAFSNSELDSWKEFIESNYLQDFFLPTDKEYKKVKKLSPSRDAVIPKRNITANNMTTDEKINFIKEMDEYFGNAISIIEARAERLANVKITNNN